VLGIKPAARATVLRFNLYDQLVQAATAGHGLAIGRLPLNQRGLTPLILQSYLRNPGLT